MTNDGKFWGPVVEGERIVAWTRVDSPVPGAAEAMRDGVPMRFLRFRDGAVVRLSESEIQEILDAEAAEAAQREANAQAALVAAEEARAQSQADYEARRAAEFVAMAPMVRTYRDTLRKHFGPNAETNREVTETAVAAYFEAKRIPESINAVETADAIALTRYFAILAAWNGTGETWTMYEKYGNLLEEA
jgi:hypothetical protein